MRNFPQQCQVHPVRNHTATKLWPRRLGALALEVHSVESCSDEVQSTTCAVSACCHVGSGGPLCAVPYNGEVQSMSSWCKAATRLVPDYWLRRFSLSVVTREARPPTELQGDIWSDACKRAGLVQVRGRFHPGARRSFSLAVTPKSEFPHRRLR